MRRLVLAVLVGVLIGTIQPGPVAHAEQPPTVSVDSPWVRARAVSGEAEPVVLTVAIEGTGPFTWSGRASVMNRDVGRVLELAPAPGAPALTTGAQQVAVSTTGVFDHPGAHAVSFTVVDGLGAETTVETQVRVVGRTIRPRVAGVSRFVAPGRKRVVRARGDAMVPRLAYRVHFRAAGARRFRIVGSTRRFGPDGVWTIRVRRVRQGAMYVRAVSPYVVPTRSRTVRITRRAFGAAPPMRAAPAPSTR
ncbi:hypothetical protein [Nocardioides pantholopis]|uniref:hypothetical protein n=1 Tax=Nocardioides pantholopis TaxID=2483798 RepID=UPI000FD85144|nr:hypothetical protein [Nocardioides pantholopis]